MLNLYILHLKFCICKKGYVDGAHGCDRILLYTHTPHSDSQQT
jgi:hypothetical protein